MVVTPFGIDMLVRLLHPLNILGSMLVMLLGRVTLTRFEHSSKTALPRLVTLFGIVMLVRLSQPQNAQAPMLVTLLGIVTLVRPEQP